MLLSSSKLVERTPLLIFLVNSSSRCFVYICALLKLPFAVLKLPLDISLILLGFQQSSGLEGLGCDCHFMKTVQTFKLHIGLIKSKFLNIRMLL